MKKYNPIGYKIDFYIYVDDRCGTGWATYLSPNKYLILLGVKSAIELNMCSKEIIRKVIYHEFGHIINWIYRNKFYEIKNFENSNFYEPIYMIYFEGFAQFFLKDFLGDNIWFQNDTWLNWCNINLKSMLIEYSKYIRNNKSVHDFFNILNAHNNHSQTGYYIGFKFIADLFNRYTFDSVTKMNYIDIKNNLCYYIKRITT